MLRRTKIIATLGPALDDETILEQVILAGANVFRANFSHGEAADHERRINAVKKIALKHHLQIGVFADLQGPKIRVSRFKNKKVNLKVGAAFVLDSDMAKDDGDEHAVGIDYKELPKDVRAGDILLLDDGRIVFSVEKVAGNKIHCKVTVGGDLSNNKGINRKGGGLTAKALTDKDKADLKAAAKIGVDYMAISFPRSAADMEEAKALIKAANSSAGVIAKIERTEAMAAIDEIINASDAVMVARGDLGVEIGDAELPAAQKLIIHRARMLNKVAITATQMMETMIENSIPTRAEVSDVANAVLDGTDAVMLSAETASGKHPVETVAAMARICEAAEKQPNIHLSQQSIEPRFKLVDEAIAMATMYTANHLNIKAIACFTESGSTPLTMSRVQSCIPIFGFSQRKESLGRMTLFRGVYPVPFDASQYAPAEINQRTAAELVKRDVVKKGELVIITKGDQVGVHGRTNDMRIHVVE